MAGRTCQHVGLLQQRRELDLGVLHADVVDGEVGLAVLHARQHLVGALLDDAHEDARMALAKGANHRRQEMMDRGEDAADRDVAALELGRVAQAEHRAVHILDQSAHLAEEARAERGEADAARRAVEQAHVELAFEMGDAPRQRRLRQVQRLRGGGEALQLADGDERAQVGERGLQHGDADWCKLMQQNLRNLQFTANGRGAEHRRIRQRRQAA